MKKIAVLAVILLVPFTVFAAVSPVDRKLGEMYRLAERAIERKDFPMADFQIARFLAVTESSQDTKKGYDSVVPLFNKMQDRLKETGFISGKYHASFVNFFFSGPRVLWDLPEQNIKKDGMCAVRSNIDGTNTYVAMFIMAPCLKRWQYMPDRPLSVVIPMGSAARGATIQAGRVSAKGSVDFFSPYDLKPGKYQNIQWVWNVEFHDLDGDNVPEIWARYNVTVSDGFTQRLDIFKIVKNSGLRLLKRFEGKDEGIARRRGDGTIETGCGYSDDKSAGHLDYDRYMLERWKYDGKNFIKTGSSSVKHALLSEEWKKYYYQGDE
jgi:hypothetical protein